MLALCDVVEIYAVKLVATRLIVGEPLAVWRERGGGELADGVLQQSHLCASGHVHEHDAVFAVGVDDAVAGGAPLKVAYVGVVVAGELHGLAALRRTHPQFCLASGIADVGDILPVGTPLGFALVHAGGAGEVARHALLHGHVKHLATRAHHHAVAIGRQMAGGDEVFHMAQLIARRTVLAVQFHVHLVILFAVGVEHIEVAAVFKHDFAASARRKFHIVVGELRHFARYAAHGVVHKDVHGLVAVAHEIDFIAHPHGVDVLSHVVGHVFHRAVAGVVNPDVVGHAALVVFPCAEFAEHTVVGHAFAVGSKTAESAFGQRQLLRHAAVAGRAPQLAVETVAHAVAEYHALAIGGPRHHDVIGTHAVAPVVTRIVAGEGDASGLAAARRNHINLGIAVVLSCESDALAVGRVAGEGLIAFVRRQSHCAAAVHRYRVQVAGITESDFGAVGARETKETSLVGM